jgi:hypothetical protein
VQTNVEVNIITSEILAGMRGHPWSDDTFLVSLMNWDFELLKLAFYCIALVISPCLLSKFLYELSDLIHGR